MRKILTPTQLSENAQKEIDSFHPEYVTEVEKAISSNQYVIVGMAQNPIVTRARKILDEAKISYKYLEYGSYFSKWKERLALKIWSGWPTFPMVFIDGKLIGGAKELKVWFAQKKS